MWRQKCVAHRAAPFAQQQETIDMYIGPEQEGSAKRRKVGQTTASEEAVDRLMGWDPADSGVDACPASTEAKTETKAEADAAAALLELQHERVGP